jgi:Ca2+-binding EF-hand superfamily protein
MRSMAPALSGAMVEKRFKVADPDNDGTVSAAEFETAAGRSLSKLLY